MPLPAAPAGSGHHDHADLYDDDCADLDDCVNHDDDKHSDQDDDDDLEGGAVQELLIGRTRSDRYK